MTLTKNYRYWFLFKRVCKTAKSDCWLHHVCPSVRMEQLGSQWRDFYAIWYLSIFQNSVQKIQLKSDNNGGTLREDQHNFFIISRSVLLRMGNVSDENCRKNQNTHFEFSNLFSKIVWKNIVGPGRPQMAIWRMLITCWIITGYRHILRICNTNCSPR